MQAPIVRRIAIVTTLLLAFGLVLTSLTYAQDGPRQLTPGEPVTGTLSTDNFAESYVFAASAGDTITLRATTTADDLSLSLLLTDPDGSLSSATGDEAAIISNTTLEVDGAYVVTVLRSSGADGEGEGDYTLSLVGQITPPDEGEDTASANNTPPVVFSGNDTFISLNNGGVDFSLEWFAPVDLDLEVRDPVGGALFFDNLSVSSGGQHDGNVNNLCEDAVESPVETALWPQGFVPAGSYEVIIYYQNPCATGGPQTFELAASVDNEDTATISGVLNPGQRYLARVEIDATGAWTLFNGGVDTGALDLSRVAEPIDAEIGQSYTGNISNDKPKDAYIFQGTAGQAVEISMTATSGSLDTLVILQDPTGQSLASNDDLDVGITNSLITATLPSNGEYTVLATRYGQVIGGTEGDYTLTIGTPAQVVAAPDADTGDTGVTATQPATTNIAGPPQGSIEVRLDWATNADLQLLVREPGQGETIFDDNPSGFSGGILDQNFVGNRNCDNTTTSPTSYIYWPVNRDPAVGTYEVEIWFQNDCDDPRPVTFDLSIEIEGQLLAPPGATSTVTNTATQEGNRYMITFVYDPAGGFVLGDGGFFQMNSPNTLNYGAELPTAQTITIDVPITGQITQEQRFIVYAFEGRSGDRISISMNRLNGTLDPALFLLDPNGVPLDNNDDIDPGEITDSLIDDITLQVDGTYFIIATHYGLQYGATEGDFQLLVSGL
jgi:hypothetical protein